MYKGIIYDTISISNGIVGDYKNETVSFLFDDIDSCEIVVLDENQDDNRIGVFTISLNDGDVYVVVAHSSDSEKFISLLNKLDNHFNLIAD
jgi:hypothetical protein